MAALPEADPRLTRTHPATVAAKSLRSAGSVFFALLALAFLGGESPMATLGYLGLIIVVTALTAGFSWLEWTFFRYGILGEDLVIVSGWPVKRRRVIPLGRVQGVDIRAALVLRILGLAEVVVQTAGGGGGEAEAKIGAIRLADAETLRTTLLHGREAAQAAAARTASGESPSGVTAATLVGGDPVGRMSDVRGAFGGDEAARIEPSFEYLLPFGRLVLASLTGRSMAFSLAVMIAIGVQFVGFVIESGSSVIDDAVGAAGALAFPLLAALTLLLGLVTVAVAAAMAIARDFGFRARRVADRIETEAGLLERRMTAMPVRRIQAVRIEEAPLRRLFGFVTVQVDTAGFGQAEEQKATTAASLIPIARRAELLPLMDDLLPEARDLAPTVALPSRSLRFFLLLPVSSIVVVGVAATWALSLIDVTPAAIAAGLTVLLGFAVAVHRTLQWRGSGYGADEHALCIASGLLGRYRARVSRSRIQSINVRQTWFQRRAGLATLTALSVSGSAAVKHVVRHMPVEDASAAIAWYERNGGRTNPVTEHPSAS